MTPDYPDFLTPQQHATAISVTGVPLLRGPNVLGSALAATLAGGIAANLIASKVIAQPSWELAILPNLPLNAGARPFLLITMTWQDLSTPTFFATKKIALSSSNGATGGLIQYGITGPSLGDLLTVSVQNLDPAQTLTYTWSLSQTSHVYNMIEVFQQGYSTPAPNGFSNPSGDPETNVIANFDASILAGGSQARLLAVAPGRWMVSLDNPGSGLITVTMTLPSGVSMTAGKEIWSIQATSNMVRDQFYAPYEPVLMTIANPSTGTITPKVGVVRCDY